MIHRFLFTATVLLALIRPASGQVNCLNSNKLICIIPNQLNLTQQSSDNLAFLNAAIGSQVGDLPLASPASGVIYTNDPKLNTPIASNATLGPILTQRAETIGRGKIYVAFTYQYFNFTDVDGQSLKNLPIYANAPDGSSVTVTNNRLDLKASQFAAYFTYGIASNIDVSAAVPILNVHEQFTTNGTIYNLTPPKPNTLLNVATSRGVVGVGDITFAAKYQAWKPKHGGLALGAELRVPSGDALNFLGTGTIGFRPFATFTYGTRFSPHANIAYEINANSYLVSLVQAEHLPNRLLYSGGVDWGVKRYFTVAVDFLAQHVYDGQRVGLQDITVSNSQITAPTIKPCTLTGVLKCTQSYTGVYGSGGIKIKPFRNLILTGNLLVSMNEAGFRARIVPLFGASYTFGR